MGRFEELLRQHRKNSRDPKSGESPLTQRKLAELAGYSDAQIGFWENGRRDIRRDTLINLIQIFCQQGGLNKLEEANRLLKLKRYEDLNDDEIQKIAPEWLGLPDGVEVTISQHTYRFTESPPTPSPTWGTSLANLTFPFLTPPLPPQGVFGRDELLTQIFDKLKFQEPDAVNIPPVALHGMGGIGKTTSAIAIGRLPFIPQHFPDGVLWVAVGQNPTIRILLDGWGRALGVDLLPERDEKACQERLRGILYHRRVLLLVDDIWEIEHGQFFQVAGPQCRTLFTTREPNVARNLATPQNTLRVDLLSPEASLALLNHLAPTAVANDRESAQRLCERLEFLPLAITLAGRLLEDEADVPSRMKRLLKELVDRQDDSSVPLDLIQEEGRIGGDEQRPISVGAILGMSIDRLKPVHRERFAMAGVFGGDPLTWDIDAAAFVWECTIEDAEATTSLLIKRGLVERRDNEYWMHALLADYAEALMNEMGL